MNPILTCMRAHRTVRRFRSDALPEDVVHEAIQCAQKASTSHHVQGYALLRVRNPATRQKLAELTGDQPQVAEAGAFFVVCAEQRRHRLATQAAGEPFESNLESFLVGIVDASLFAQNLALAFESQDYGVCFIGGLRTRLAEVDELLDLPQDVFPLFGLCVGVPRERPDPRPRLPLAGVLFEERYGSEAQTQEAVEQLDAELGPYFARRGRPHYTWSGAIARLFRRPQRPQLKAYYESKGARLR